MTTTAISTCPHDCPSACSLEVELLEDGRIGRLRGAAGQSYTAGVICAKVARYAERLHHPDRLLYPLLRSGPKGSGQFRRIGWDEALDRAAEAMLAAERHHGSESVWPYYYAGTMGRVQRDGINRLRHAKGYSGFYQTICINTAWGGWLAGTGRLAGVDPREMAKSDCVVIWGTNPVSTQVNVMTHAIRARKERGATIVAVDVYMTDTMEQADMALLVRPGTDAALACAVIHVLLRDGHADRAYLARFTDWSPAMEEHFRARDPAWAAGITGLDVAEIEAFAALVGRTPRSFFRLGYGFTRQRNGAVAMHAALCIPAVTGAWQHEGGGAFHNNGAIYHLDQTLIEGLDVADPSVRKLEQAAIGRILTGDVARLQAGPPVKALLVQNTNPLNVCPEQALVRRGLAREDLFTIVHEHFLTDTARMADLVLPATMFLEHDDFYTGGGHMHLMWGPKLLEPPGEARENHRVICDLARRLGAEHRGFTLSARELVDETLRASGWGGLARITAEGWLDCQPDFRTAHYLDGFAHTDGRFHFRPDWPATPYPRLDLMGPAEEMPELPDHWAVIEEADAEYPFRLVTAPARSFLNSSFAETPSSQKREGTPSLFIHPEDAAALAVGEGEPLVVESPRGRTVLSARLFAGVRRGVVVAEGLHPNRAHRGGMGINALTAADQVAPFGGAAFHDNKVAVRRHAATVPLAAA